MHTFIEASEGGRPVARRDEPDSVFVCDAKSLTINFEACN